MSMMGKELYQFGAFVLDTQERVVLRDGLPLPVTPKAYETLLYLVQNPRRTLTKDELLQNIWPDTFVEEVNLAVNISALRKLLGDSPQDGRYIVTVSGRGYKFVAEVQKTTAEPNNGRIVETLPGDLPNGRNGLETNDAEPVLSLPKQFVSNPDEVVLSGSPASPAANSVQSSFFFRRFGFPLLIAVLLTALGVIFWRQHNGVKTLPVAASIAVLPFVDLSPNHDQEYFSEGLADELTNDLAKVQGLKVISRSSAFQFKGKNEDLRLVGQKLGVENVLEGSVRKQGNRVRITAELTKAKDGFQLWSETYDREVGDAIAVQEEIARAVTSALQGKILANEDGNLFRSSRNTNAEAYEAYLQARYFYERGEDRDDLEKALAYADQSIQSDSKFAPAWALRSFIINTSSSIGWRDHQQTAREAREDAERSLTLDPTLASGYVALAWIKVGYEWDWDGARKDLKKAAELQPGSALVLSYRAYLYECLGELDEAIAVTEEASALDPLRANAYLGELLYLAGRYEEARAFIQKSLAINPKLEGAHSTLAYILLAQGRLGDSLKEASNEPGEWQRLTSQAVVYHALGRRSDSDVALSRLISGHSNDSPYQVAEIYAYRGESNSAFQWMNRAYDERDPGLNQLKLDPLLKNIRSDPRYSELLKKMRLPLN